MKISFLFIFILLSFKLYASNIIFESDKGSKIYGKKITQFDYPWSIKFIEDEKLLVSTMNGTMWLVETNGKKNKVSNIPKTFFGGQGGLGDIALHSNFKRNSIIFFSLVESNDNGKTRGSIVYSAKLIVSPKPKLINLKIIWRQHPHLESKVHFSQKILIPPKNSIHKNKIFISSGDRRNSEISHLFNNSLGKIIRLSQDGSIPKDNPFQNNGELAKIFWTIGHRNVLGMVFDKDDNFFINEMGPKHGDELNIIKKGKDYGWPFVSEGNHYDGRKIPQHKTNKNFEAPVISWTPSIAPSSFIIYNGNKFFNWKHLGLISSLIGKSLVVVNLSKPFKEVERVRMKKRIRDLDQSPSEDIWIIEDGKKASLIKIYKIKH